MFSIFGFLVVFPCFYFCCCDRKADQDESISERVKPAINLWNSANEENGVIAEYIEAKEERRGKSYVEISPSLCLWKRADSASKDNARRILELEQKISDMEKEKSAMKKETAYIDIGLEGDKKLEESEPLFPPPPYQSPKVPEWRLINENQ